MFQATCAFLSSKQEAEPATISTERRFCRVQRTSRILQLFVNKIAFTATYRRAFQSFDFFMLHADFILLIGTFDAAQPCRTAKRTKYMPPVPNTSTGGQA